MKKMKITSCKNAGNGFPIPTRHILILTSEMWEISVGNVFTLTLKNGRSVRIQEDMQVHTGISLQHPPDTGTQGCVCVCLCIPSGAAAAPGLRQQLGTAGSRNLQDVQGRSQLYPAGMCNTGCKSWQAQQFLFGSGYFSVLCLWYNAPFCLVLRHLSLILCWSFALCVFVLGFITWNTSARIRRDPPPFQPRSTVGHSGEFGWVCSAPALVARLTFVVGSTLRPHLWPAVSGFCSQKQ